MTSDPSPEPGVTDQPASQKIVEVDLPATTEEIYKNLPRFRLLLVGNSGVGKSSLINRAFNVDDAGVSKGTPGACEIDREITSPHNPRVVVHDSQGFEPGETGNFNIVDNFVRGQQAQEDHSERVHAVWLCILTPTAKGAIIERGTEELVKLCRELNIPLIIVFTQFDLFVNQATYELQLKSQAAMDEKRRAKALKQATNRFETDCLRVVKEYFRSVGVETPPVVKVSVKEGHAKFIVELIQVTAKTVERLSPESVPRSSRSTTSPILAPFVTGVLQTFMPRIKEDGRFIKETVLLATCQAVDRESKVEMSIEIGKKNYWRGIADNKLLPRLLFLTFLKTIHWDIVNIWNFPGSNNPESYIRSTDFLDRVTRLSDRGSSRSVQVTAKNIGIAGGIAGVAGAIAPLVAPAVVPAVFFAVLLLAWVVEVYRETPDTVRRMMAYIIDLTNIMRGVFDIIPYSNRSQVVERETVEGVIKSYSKLEWRKTLHTEIEDFSKGPNGLKKDKMVDKIIELIKKYDYQTK